MELDDYKWIIIENIGGISIIILERQPLGEYIVSGLENVKQYTH